MSGLPNRSKANYYKSHKPDLINRKRTSKSKAGDDDSGPLNKTRGPTCSSLGASGAGRGLAAGHWDQTPPPPPPPPPRLCNTICLYHSKFNLFPGQKPTEREAFISGLISWMDGARCSVERGSEFPLN